MGIVEIIAENRIVSGIIMVCIASLVFAVVRRGNRFDPDAGWVSNDMVYFVYAPFVTVITALGAGTAFSGAGALGTQPPTGMAVVIGAAVLLTTVIGCYLLGRDPQAAQQPTGLGRAAAR